MLPQAPESLRETGPIRMSPLLRAPIYVIFGALWFSGCFWLGLHFLFEPVGEFGRVPHPAEHGLMVVHGAVAVAGVFLLGWMTAAHVVERWRRGRRLWSGIPVAAVGGLLVVSGYLLYYSIDRLHEMASAVHEVLGAAGIVLALIHWRGR